MRILFTGSSSFTGYWFIKELLDAGHEVIATFRSAEDSYEGIRKERVNKIKSMTTTHFNCAFGSESFFQVVKEKSDWDLLCHHAAEVGQDFKSLSFDPIAALQNNTHHFCEVLDALKKKGCEKLVLTGSVFEPEEGLGSDARPGILPYGLSKGLTFQYIRHFALDRGWTMGKFVIPNPFGELEEDWRFTSYLAKSWLKGESVEVRTPSYVRDNIPVSLLAKAYSYFASNLQGEGGLVRFNPSYYVGGQGDFTRRFSDEMKKRWNKDCAFTCANQKEFPEPKVRYNPDLLDPSQLGWNEEAAWDSMAEFYESKAAELVH